MVMTGIGSTPAPGVDVAHLPASVQAPQLQMTGIGGQ
jgi:hypothetical protein